MSLRSGLSGRDHYEVIFSERLHHEAEWLRRVAHLKADSVELLLARNGIRPRSILELGCGTGAVISELRRRSLAREYYAVDYSEGAVSYLASTSPGIRCAVADVVADPNPFGEAHYDVIVVSHTIEHLEEPPAFLAAMRRLDFGFLIAEVPLENLVFGRLKSLVIDRRDERANPAGHVQFFDRSTFRGLLQNAGFEVVGDRLYAPALDQDTFEFAYGQSSWVRRVHKRLTEYYLPKWIGPVWERVWHAHYALLCRGTSALNHQNSEAV